METKMISIELYGDPVPQQRPRFARRGNFVHTYDNQSQIKEGYRWQIKSQYREEALKSSVFIDATFYMPIPKSTSRLLQRQMLNGVVYHRKKPDTSNMFKFIEDALVGIVLEDDNQVVEIRARKVYSSKPGTLIRIIPMEDQIKGVIDEIPARNIR
jgi:Holliday junction resolvase RusA-like endonuclease